MIRSVISNQTNISSGSYFFYYDCTGPHTTNFVLSTVSLTRSRSDLMWDAGKNGNKFIPNTYRLDMWLDYSFRSLARSLAGSVVWCVSVRTSCIERILLSRKPLFSVSENRNASHWWHNHLLKYLFECLRRYEKWTPKRFRNSESTQMRFSRSAHIHTLCRSALPSPWRQHNNRNRNSKKMSETHRDLEINVSDVPNYGLPNADVLIKIFACIFGGCQRSAVSSHTLSLSHTRTHAHTDA